MKRQIQLVKSAIDVGDTFSFLQDARAGGISLFIGTTRRWTAGKETVRLEYDCYEPMALKEMDRLADEAQQRWTIVRCSLIHRTGVVPVKEASVVIGVAAPHRGDAYAASRFLIDTLKETVPIWKREVYADGTTEWVEGSSTDLSEKKKD